MSDDWFHGSRDLEEDDFGPNASVGRAIKVRRAELGLERRELAEAAGLSYPYVAEIENGAKAGSTRALRAIAAALDLELHELLAQAAELPPLVQRSRSPRSFDSEAFPVVASMPSPPSFGSRALRRAKPSSTDDELLARIEPFVRSIVRDELRRTLTDLADDVEGR